MTEKLKVMVIDDEKAVRQTLRENLELCGFDVTEALDGEHGVHLIDTNADGKPAVIVTDIIMPKKEGLETILEVRKRYPDIRIIAITGGGRTRAMDFLDLAKSLGADAVFPKSVNMDRLEQIVRVLGGI